MNKNLAKILNLMAQKDQAMRKRATKTGLFDKRIDKENTAKLKIIMQKYGWPTISSVGKKASKNAWLIVQHADHDIKLQKNVLKLLKKINSKNSSEIDKSNMAFLEDRILLNEGKYQSFGTQFYTNKKGIFGLWPVKNIKNIDKLRKEYNLPPLRIYLKMAESYKQKGIGIKIEYSKSFEIRRVAETLRKLEWFNKMGYRLSLPVGFGSEVKKPKLKLADIKKSINKEYKQKDYRKIDLAIKKKAGKLLKKLPEQFSKFGLKSKSVYKVFLTKYGVGGSYQLPNTIVIKIKGRGVDDIVRTLIHEITHLLIEPFIQKHKISHWQKERLVDILFAKTFPKIAIKQNLPQKEVVKGDKIFNKFFGKKAPDNL